MLRHAPWIALAAGAASAIGFAPLELWPVTLACVALLLWLVHRAPSLKAALWRGWLFGLGYFTVGNNWIQHAFDYQDRMPPALGYFAVVLLALYLAIYPALAMGLAWRYGRRDAPDLGFVLVAAAAWIVTEWLRAGMFTGYAWNPLGVVWLPVIGVARLSAWVGTYALSGVTVLAAGALMLAAFRRWRVPAAVALLLALAALGGIAFPQSPAGRPDSRPLVRVVQPNIGQQAAHDEDYAEQTLAKLIAWSGNPGPTPRLLVWPEGMVNFFVEDGYPPGWYQGVPPELIRARIAATLGPRDLALVGGNALFFGPREQRGGAISARAAGSLTDLRLTGAGNSIFALTPAGELLGRYDKAHLVPYGEYLPMRSLLEPLGLSRLVMGDIDFVPGPGPATIATPGFGKAGMQVCYEIIFSGQVASDADRPDFIFNPSNDAWFGSWGPPQHLAQARMRAIEEGLPVLRSTPTGISAVIDAGGRLVATVPAGREGAIEVPLPAPHPPTPFARLGNLLAFLVAGLMLLGAIAFRRFAR